MPDEARDVARELGLYYYETSVLTYYGVNEVFENAIRAALIARRQQRFWMTNLKKVCTHVHLLIILLSNAKICLLIILNFEFLTLIVM